MNEAADATPATVGFRKAGENDPHRRGLASYIGIMSGLGIML